jgi:hypothetical protein
MAHPNEPPSRLVRLRRAARAFAVAPHFAPETARSLASLGVRAAWPRMPGTIHHSGQGYLRSRAAPLGAATPRTVAAVLGLFPASIVAEAFALGPDTSPTDLLAARADAAEAYLTRVLGPVTDDVRAAGVALERAVEHLDVSARPLYAALAERPWPRAPWQAVWHGAVLLFEHHRAGLLGAAARELNARELVIIRALANGDDADAVLRELGWAEPDCRDAWADLAARRLVLDGALTPEGDELWWGLRIDAARSSREVAIRLLPRDDDLAMTLTAASADLWADPDVATAIQGNPALTIC